MNLFQQVAYFSTPPLSCAWLSQPFAAALRLLPKPSPGWSAGFGFPISIEPAYNCS
jgi:hypothetical protein